MSVFLELKKYIDLLHIIDTHCHKMPSHKGFPEGIKDLVEHSYLGWCHFEWDGTREGAKGEICFFQEFFFVFVCVDR